MFPTAEDDLIGIEDNLEVLVGKKTIDMINWKSMISGRQLPEAGLGDAIWTNFYFLRSSSSVVAIYLLYRTRC